MSIEFCVNDLESRQPVPVLTPLSSNCLFLLTQDSYVYRPIQFLREREQAFQLIRLTNILPQLLIPFFPQLTIMFHSLIECRSDPIQRFRIQYSRLLSRLNTGFILTEKLLFRAASSSPQRTLTGDRIQTQIQAATYSTRLRSLCCLLTRH